MACSSRARRPMVLSYTTSPAYHIIEEKTDNTPPRVRRGPLLQVEVAGRSPAHRRTRARRQVPAVHVSPEFQDEIPDDQLDVSGGRPDGRTAGGVRPLVQPAQDTAVPAGGGGRASQGSGSTSGCKRRVNDPPARFRGRSPFSCSVSSSAARSRPCCCGAGAARSTGLPGDALSPAGASPSRSGQALLSTLLSVGLGRCWWRVRLARRTRFPGRTLLLRLFGLPMVMPAIVAHPRHRHHLWPERLAATGWRPAPGCRRALPLRPRRHPDRPCLLQPALRRPRLCCGSGGHAGRDLAPGHPARHAQRDRSSA